VRIGVRAKLGATTVQKGVVILASGLACIQGDNFQCARQP
jgi:hypothetical protein